MDWYANKHNQKIKKRQGRHRHAETGRGLSKIDRIQRAELFIKGRGCLPQVRLSVPLEDAKPADGVFSEGVAQPIKNNTGVSLYAIRRKWVIMMLRRPAFEHLTFKEL